MKRKTKIICTLGPAVDNEEMIKQLMLNGMDCARLNFSHGDHAEQLERINRVKKVREELGLPIPMLLDTKGPEIRTLTFAHGPVNIKKGQRFDFVCDLNYVGNENGVGVNFETLYQDLTVGAKILVDDGAVEFEVKAIEDNVIQCVALNSGKLSNRKSINIPNVAVSLPFISEKDRVDILFGIKHGIDYIAASFVREAKDVNELRKLLNENGGGYIKIISKIENLQGINNLKEIVDVSDGVMIARGDMGVEVPFEHLPPFQKDIIKECYFKGKIVVTATQMLESMTKSPRPTRAEVSDVANAIYDGTTAIMLSGETAMGEYPIESVKTMAQIALRTEDNINYKKRFESNHLQIGVEVMSAVANAACISANQLDATILAITRRGVTARAVANYRPNGPIVAVTPHEQTCRQLNLVWNVTPLIDKTQFNGEVNIDFDSAIAKALDHNLIQKGDMVVMAGGVKLSDLQTGLVKIHKA